MTAVLSPEWFAKCGNPLPKSRAAMVAEIAPGRDVFREERKKLATEIALLRYKVLDEAPYMAKEKAAVLIDALVALERRNVDAEMEIRRIDLEVFTLRQIPSSINTRVKTVEGSWDLDSWRLRLPELKENLVGGMRRCGEAVEDPSREEVVETARAYDVLARILLSHDDQPESQRRVAYYAGEIPAEYLGVLVGMYGERKHLLRWWANWPLVRVEGSEIVVNEVPTLPPTVKMGD